MIAPPPKISGSSRGGDLIFVPVIHLHDRSWSPPIPTWSRDFRVFCRPGKFGPGAGGPLKISKKWKCFKIHENMLISKFWYVEFDFHIYFCQKSRLCPKFWGFWDFEILVCKIKLVCKIHARSRDQVGMGADQLLSWRCITSTNIKSPPLLDPEIWGGVLGGGGLGPNCPGLPRPAHGTCGSVQCAKMCADKF